ncbi:hypothetical protein CLV24_12719 [Pontibacter ummariensis]|uniref:Acyl carrier protein n=1 Tax=Pontibacter ummariensis TaxID=1610492 RepID=A0A239KE09_9BACT|nr:hypothetical protein [Pontibacter ummariensis]PRY06400.1 hypothetical protein CLV24_12719 [Pontibacter ummariensis]SNT16587.1 hypothetical protein SAMN06296052_12819 [Pontibacter ummariensis]
MYDVSSLVRFELARLISKRRQKDLSQVLYSSSFSQLELGLVDVIDLLFEIEQQYFIHVPDKYLVHSLEDVVSLICGNSAPEPFSYQSSAAGKALCF